MTTEATHPAGEHGHAHGSQFMIVWIDAEGRAASHIVGITHGDAYEMLRTVLPDYERWAAEERGATHGVPGSE